MKTTTIISTLALIAGVVVMATLPTKAQNAGALSIALQGTTPGTVQSGHGNISGTFKAGYLKGNGTGVTGLNAANVTTGILSDDRLSTNIPRLAGGNDFKSTQKVGGYLSVYGGSITVCPTAPFTNTKVYLGMPNADYGEIHTYGKTGKSTTLLSTPDGYPSQGWMGVRDSVGTTQAKMYVDSTGKGVVSADVKNFVVPNPRNEAEDIVYASLEGPEAGAYVRGTGKLVNGKAHIELPDHFSGVTVSEGLTVQLTAKSGASLGLAYLNDSNSGFDVVELHNGKGTYEFSWEVTAVRRMHEDYRPVRKWNENLAATDDPATLWQARLSSIRSNEAAYSARRKTRP